MKKILCAVSLLIIVINSVGFSQSDNDYQQRLIRINKALDDFARAYNYLLDYHIANVDPELIIQSAIRGMTNSLDSYTELLNEADSESFNVLTTNHYTGVGIVTTLRDSMLTIVDVVDGGPANKVGIRVGDRIMKIDNNYVLYANDDNSRNLLKGELNTEVALTILRGCRHLDTLNFNLIRDNISQRSLSYHQLIDDSIAYIQVQDFSADTKSEFKSAFLDMKSKSGNNLKGLLIDLRGNSGGIMLSAVDLYELFVPVGTLFGSVENKTKQKNQIFTKTKPLDTEIPIAVIVNNYSASASEFLASSLQDIGRAVIVGEKTFGKGISQIIRDLPSGKGLKITVDKFYTPLGRAINTVEIRPKYLQDTSTLKIDTLTTKYGKAVLSNSAVIPDSIIESKEYSPYLMELISKDAFFSFANEISSQNIKFDIESELNDVILEQFKDFSDSMLVGANSEMEKAVKSIQDIFEKDEIPESLKQNFNALKSGISEYYNLAFNKNKEEIRDILALEVLRRYYPNSEVYSYMLKKDKYKSAAIEVLMPMNYQVMLRQSNTKQL